jgi:hypothetical protein
LLAPIASPDKAILGTVTDKGESVRHIPAASRIKTKELSNCRSGVDKLRSVSSIVAAVRLVLMASNSCPLSGRDLSFVKEGYKEGLEILYKRKVNSLISILLYYL